MTSTVDGQATRPPDGTEPGRRLMRRSVVRGLGLGGATLAVAGSGLLSYRAYDAGVLDPGGGSAREPWRHWRDVPGPLGTIAAAVLAASPHNTQPWAFARAASSIDVFTDAARNTGSVDPYGTERYIGLGCALENLVLASGPRGLRPAVSLLPDGPSGERVAHVELAQATPSTSPLYDVIDQRHTNRGPYQPMPVPAAALTALTDLTGLDGCRGALGHRTRPEEDARRPAGRRRRGAATASCSTARASARSSSASPSCCRRTRGQRATSSGWTRPATCDRC